ncbi:cytosolic 5'-nucleotidase 3-like [Daphnia pulex]|uniref:cytosolic 5'-nucleotidase 3-like n=1 Tax=Daphnia pulex TaxID=6669 RepID=UPI001EDD3E44|nr:cytosolic 5'-nucleotidase 3-like [Daphnia pulex]
MSLRTPTVFHVISSFRVTGKRSKSSLKATKPFLAKSTVTNQLRQPSRNICNIKIMDNLISLIPNLKLSHVHVKDWQNVGDKINKLIAGTHDKLQVIADFDFTLTKFHVDGVRKLSCHGVVENYSKLPDHYKLKSKEMFNKYYPIEIDQHMSVEEKIPLMIEWYDGAHELLEHSNLYKHDFALMVKENPIEFRDGTLQFMKDLKAANIPILVFSAGVGDVIDEALLANNLTQDNVKVISNYMTYNTEGKLVAFTDKLIHMYNKNETSIPHSSTYFQDLSHRHNVILLGDSLGDLQMSKGVEPPSTVLTIGFLNDKIEERLEKYKGEFDIVLVDDQSMDIPDAILKSVLANES